MNMKNSKPIRLLRSLALNFQMINLALLPASLLAAPLPENPSKATADLLIKQGLDNIAKNKPELALTNALDAIKMDNNSSEAYFLKGRAEQDIGLKNEALNDYTKAILINPKHARAYSNRALIKGSLGKMNEALEDLNKAISIDSNLASAFLNRGVTKGALGLKKEAIKDFDAAIKINPRYQDAYRNRGITKELTGDLKGACADWKTAASFGQTDAREWISQQCKS